MSADYVVLVDDNRNVLEGERKRWREILKKNGLKIIRGKTIQV